jgi:hypothetical protein
MSKLTKIGLPPGGSTGEVLKKKTGTNYDVEWGTGGGGGSGSVTSVATTSPITGGTITTTGTIGITQATTSTDGYLSSTDWNTFNGKQNALTNPVTGTGTSGQVAYWSGTTTQTGSNNLFWDNTNERLGVGTNAPGYKLDIRGNLAIQTSGQFLEFKSVSGSNSFIGGGGNSINTSVGINNNSYGFSALNGITDGYDNTAIGKDSLLLCTTGFWNVAIGNSALRSGTSIRSNVAVGFQALYSGGYQENVAIGKTSLFSSGSNNSYNTALGSGSQYSLNGINGTNNSSIGYNSLYSNLTGAYNVALGNYSLFRITTGSNNTAIGGTAGAYISSGGNLTSSNNSIFIGYDTRANAVSETNQTVIGYSAIGLGSNTTVIGNSSTTYGRWWGNLLVGTSTNAGYALDVNGTARIVNYLYVTGSGSSGLASSAINTPLYLWNRRTSTSGDGITIEDFNEINGSNVNINILNFVSSSSVKTGASTTLNVISISKTYDLALTTTSAAIIRGFYYNPTITNLRVAQHRAIETTTGDIYFASTSGSVGIGVLPTSTYKLDVNGTVRIQDNLTISDAKNVILDTTTGTKIGTASSQKLSFWNAAPIVQPTTAVAAATLIGGGGTTITDTDTFDGYTLKQIVKALRNTGILA